VRVPGVAVFGGVLLGLLVAPRMVLGEETPAAVPAPVVPAGRAAAPLASVPAASLATIMADVKAPGARAVLVNVWATWCEPCLEELPQVLRFYRENRARGLRLVLISADDDERVEQVKQVLGTAVAAAGMAGTFDGRTFVKQENDMRFIDGIDHEWSGALPASFLFDGHGQRMYAWHGPVTYDDLRGEIANRLTEPPVNTKKKKSTSRRQP
jgi:thiol-disulfide isomerase/thioredoxin